MKLEDLDILFEELKAAATKETKLVLFPALPEDKMIKTGNEILLPTALFNKIRETGRVEPRWFDGMTLLILPTQRAGFGSYVSQAEISHYDKFLRP